MLLSTIAHLESRIDALLLDSAGLCAKIQHVNNVRKTATRPVIRKDKHGNAVIYSADGMKIFAHDNWDYLVNEFKSDPSGGIPMRITDTGGLPDTRMVSREFRDFVIGKFEYAKAKEHAKIYGNKDMTGDALDGASNNQKT